MGAGKVRLLGHRGATTRIDSGTAAAESAVHRAPARSLISASTGPDLEADDPTLDDLDD